MKASLSEKSNAANKLKQIKDDKDDILLWAKFISSERKEDFEMLATKNTYIQSAYKTLQVISQDDQKRMEYEARGKALRDYNQGMLGADQIPFYHLPKLPQELKDDKDDILLVTTIFKKYIFERSFSCPTVSTFVNPVLT